MNAKMVLFVNFLSLIAPSMWVVIAGALGFSAGAYGPKLLQRFKHDHLSNLVSSGTVPKVSKQQRPRRAANSFRTKTSPAPIKQRRKRPATGQDHAV